jgi:lipoic acid synthetase
MEEKRARKPEWLKVKSNEGQKNAEIAEMLRRLNLHTVCEEANCPNIGECFCMGTVTFMIMGKNCTRNCTFCNVTKSCPQPLDKNEPQNIASALKKLNIKYIVITSVTRDDLSDGGAAHFADVILTIKKELKEKAPKIEVLVPDFKGDYDALKTVINAKPDIISHNIETVERLYPYVRPMARYDRSLQLLSRLSENGVPAKSGIMLGLGETEEEVIKTLKDLYSNGCRLLTIGQYLSPSKLHYPVKEYITPQVFQKYKDIARQTGFLYTASAPLVRSSYMAEKGYIEICKN